MNVENPNGGTKSEIDSILTNRSDSVTDVTVINQDNIGSDHRMAMSNIKLDADVEIKQLMTMRQPRVDATQIGSKEVEFQLELRNRFEKLQELDHIDTMSEVITDMVPQTASRVAKANQQDTELEDIITNMSPDDETTRNGDKRRR